MGRKALAFAAGVTAGAFGLAAVAVFGGKRAMRAFELMFDTAVAGNQNKNGATP